MKKIDLVFLLFIITYLIVTPVIKGEETDISVQKSPGSGGVRQEIKKDKVKRIESIKDKSVKDNRMEIKEKIKLNRDEIKETVKEKQIKIKEKREEIEMTIQKQREEAKEKFEMQREEFKTKILEIKDQRTKEVVERVDGRLNTVNANRTAALTKHLDRMSSILVRIENRVAKKRSDGVDTSAVDKAVVEAQSAIDTAKEAVTSQASKEYIVTITDETKLKIDVKSAFDQFKSDMEATLLTIKQAKEALTAAARLLGGGRDG